MVPPKPLAVLLAALSTFVVGGLWYSPLLFGRAWQRAAGLSDEEVKRGVARTFIVAALSALVFAANLGFFVGGASTLRFGAFAGFATGFGFIAAGLTTSYVFARRPAKLILIDAAYHVVASTAAGVVIGLFGTG
jgi:hypothetical protein